MADRDLWQPVAAALAEYSRLGISAEFWLRDDDAISPAAALDRLIELTGLEFQSLWRSFPPVPAKTLLHALRLTHMQRRPFTAGPIKFTQA